MSAITRRLGTAAAAVAVTAGFGLATATPAHAYDSVHYYPATLVQQLVDGIDAGISVGCSRLPNGYAEACELGATLSASTGLGGEFKKAAANGCGLRVYVTATGSQMSYDKATYGYEQVC